ncbi:hypothetical protein C0992_007287 [Termitomyces sp. T32_za158]|nr:hypothetical protein C0992_007287 [Termitomyces sp. T32_za158]
MTHNAHPYTGHVLPGVCRSLIYATEQTSGRFVYLRRYTSPRFFARTNHLAHQTHRHTERHDYLGEPSAISAEIDLGPEAAARYREHGVGVAAWDQTIGRVCLTTRGGSVVQVVDFSHATPPDERFCERKVVASAGFASRKEELEDACMPPKSKRARIDDA